MVVGGRRGQGHGRGRLRQRAKGKKGSSCSTLYYHVLYGWHPGTRAPGWTRAGTSKTPK